MTNLSAACDAASQFRALSRALAAGDTRRREALRWLLTAGDYRRCLGVCVMVSEFCCSNFARGEHADTTTKRDDRQNTEQYIPLYDGGRRTRMHVHGQIAVLLTAQ